MTLFILFVFIRRLSVTLRIGLARVDPVLGRRAGWIFRIPVPEEIGNCSLVAGLEREDTLLLTLTSESVSELGALPLHAVATVAYF